MPSASAQIHALLTRCRERGFTFVLGVFLASRAILELTGVLARAVLGPFVAEHYAWRYHPSAWWDIWGVLDTGWYLRIAEQGYLAASADGQGSTLAYFPVYPMLLKALALVTGDALVAGVLLSNICFLGALWLLYDLVRARTDAQVAAGAVLLAAFFPGSYVFSSVYTESLFLLLLLGSLHYAARDRWGMAGLLGAALTGTRLLGIAALVPLGLLWVERHGWGSLRAPRSWIRLAPLALVPGGLVAFMSFLHQLTGDPLAFLHVQAGWDRGFQNPVAAFLAPLWHPTAYNRFQSLFGLGCLLALIPVARRRLWPELALALLLLGIPPFNGVAYAPLESYARYCLVAWPVFVGIALLLRDRPQARALALAALATLNGLLMAFWATGMLFVM
ncbi:MAG: glycosyltransferase family 39 protein [Pseudomonadota bacterium]